MKAALALVLGFGLAVLVAAGSAVGDTAGDIDFTASWVAGSSANQSVLTLANTGASGAQTISDFFFTITGAQITAVSGSPSGCSVVQPDKISCGGPTDPGQSNTVTITTQSPLAAGTTGTLDLYDGADAAQPSQTVAFQGGGTTSTTTTPTTTTTTAPPQTCPADTSLPRPCADVAIGGINFGLYQTQGDFEKDNAWIRQVAMILGAPLNVEFPDQPPGFYRYDLWQAGEVINVEVKVTNNGPDTASFDLSVTDGTNPLTYLGAENDLIADPITGLRHGGVKDLPYVNLDHPSLPMTLAPGTSVYLVYAMKIGKQGPLTIYAVTTGGSPVDPVPQNNHADATIQVAPGSAKSLPVIYSRSAATIGARASTTQFAALVQKGANCSWLTGASAMLSRPSAAACRHAVWLSTTSHGHGWRYKLKKPLAKGKYTVYVRDRRDQFTELSPALHNVFTLRAR